MAMPFSSSTTTGTTGGGSSLFGTPTTSTFGMSNVPTFGSSTGNISNPGGMAQANSSASGFQTSFNTVGSAGTQAFNQNAMGTNTLPEKVNSRCTVRHLTNLVPPWKGHFDVADMLLTSQEGSMNKVRLMIDRLGELDETCRVSHGHIKNSLNGISLLQGKLNKEVNDRCKYQDRQNLVSIKARRLSESLSTVGKPNGSRVSAAFRVPNHLHVQLSKELLDKIRSWNREIHNLQLEVLSLKDIDLSQYESTVQVVLKSHDKRISSISERLCKAVAGAENRLCERKEIWDNVADEASDIKKAFLKAVGLPIRPPVSDRETTSTSSTTGSSEIKKQIQYLRKFNAAFSESGKAVIDSSTYNIRDLLQQPTPQPTNQLIGGNNATTTNFYGGMGNKATGSSLFGNTSATSGSSLFGQTSTGTSNLFGSGTNTTTPNQFGSTGTTGANLFGSGTTNTNTGLFGSGSTNQTNTGLFGQQSTGFGQTSTPSSSNLFGAPTTNQATNTALFGQQNTGFGQSAGTSSNLFGSGTTNTNTGLFGSANTNQTNTGLFGSTNQSTNTGLFGQQNTGFGQSNATNMSFQQNAGSKSTAIVPYNPSPVLR